MSSLLHINYPEDDSLDGDSTCKLSCKIIERLVNSSKKRIISQEEIHLRGVSRENSAQSIAFQRTSKETIKKSSDFLSKMSSFSQIQRRSLINSINSQVSLKKHAKFAVFHSKTAKEIKKNVETTEFLVVDEDFFCKTEMMKRRLSL